MDARQLQQFLAVVDHGTIGRAARHLKISQPAISQTIAKLEGSLRVGLFNRTAQGMVPTPYGAALASRARAVSEEIRRAVEDIDALRDRGKARITVGTGPSQANQIVPEAVRRLLVTRPALSVSIVEGSLARLMPALDGGHVDLAVVTMVEAPWSRELAGETLYKDPVVVLARTGHPLARGGASPTLAACHAFPWVLPDRSDALRLKLESVVARAGLELPAVRVETASPTAIKALLMRSDFLGYAPRSLVQVEEAAGLLRVLDVPGTRWIREVQVLYRHSRALPPAAKALIRQLHAVVREPGQEAAAPAA